MCEDSCPEVFHLDDQGELVILNGAVPEALERSVLQAVRLCPVNALRPRED